MDKLHRNFIWLAAANVISSLFNISVFIYLARTLEAENFGYLSYATTLVFYLFNFIDLGLSTYGTREIAKDRTKVSEYVSNILSLKLLIASALFVFAVGAALLTSHSILMKTLLIETSLMLFAAAFATEWAFQGMERMHIVFISSVVTTFFQFSLNYLFVKGPQDITKVPLISLLGALPVIVLLLPKIGFKLTIRRLDLKKIRGYLSSSIVIWAISVFAQIYSGLDIVLLGFFRSPGEIGCFTVARRVVGGAALLMIALVNAILPHLSFTFKNDIDKFNESTRKFLKISALIIAAVFLPLAAFSPNIIALTVGREYLPAVTPLCIMFMGLTFVMFNLPYSTGLIAAGFERDVLKQAVASAALSVISNFVLMPKYGMIGASISFVMAEGLALAWIMRIYRVRIDSIVQK